MDKYFYSTIIKCLVVIILLHFVLKRLVSQARLAPVNVSAYPVTVREYDADEPVEDDDDDVSDISREDIRRSLKDFVEDVVPIAQVEPRTINANLSGLPEDKAYANYRPLDMQDDNVRPDIQAAIQLNNYKPPMPHKEVTAQEAVCNGGPLMEGVYGYDESYDTFSLVSEPPPTFPIVPVAA